jgi:hypothetical protein
LTVVCDIIEPVTTDSESSAEYRRFKSLLGRVLAVPREEMERREVEYQRQSRLNPNRRGPKLKPKPAGPDPAV